MNLSPERVIVSGDKSTLIMRPVFGEYYTLINDLFPKYEKFICHSWENRVLSERSHRAKLHILSILKFFARQEIATETIFLFALFVLCGTLFAYHHIFWRSFPAHGRVAFNLVSLGL